MTRPALTWLLALPAAYYRSFIGNEPARDWLKDLDHASVVDQSDGSFARDFPSPLLCPDLIRASSFDKLRMRVFRRFLDDRVEPGHDIGGFEVSESLS